MPRGQYIFKCLLLQHMRSIDSLIIAIPLSHACQQHLLGLCVFIQIQGQVYLQYFTSCTVNTLTQCNYLNFMQLCISLQCALTYKLLYLFNISYHRIKVFYQAVPSVTGDLEIPSTQSYNRVTQLASQFKIFPGRHAPYYPSISVLSCRLNFQ